MTKKDYELVAGQIANSLRIEREIAAEGNNTELAQLSLTVLAENLACKMVLENSRFDKERFLTACNIYSVKGYFKK